MSTPLYRYMKERGSTFYAFPSSSMHKDPKFSKFVLLNIPNKIEDERLDFEKENFNGTPFEIYTDDNNPVQNYSEQLIESLRNYVANHDATMRNSKLNNQQGFYNINEKQTPSEIIFWKWLKKMNAISFEVCEHKIDWDKNNPDFENPNADTVSNTDYFRKYLWKEREIKSYAIEYIEYQGVVTGVSNNTVRLNISYPARFKVGEKIILTGDVGTELSINTEYEILKFDENGDNTRDIYIEDTNVNVDVYNPSGEVSLSYHKVVQYVGEINAISDVRTSTKDETEVIAYIPHHAGSTPSILFTSRFDTNYYPGIELPILPEQIQTEILGAEKLESPIRQNPNDYPGLYYGQFDTSNKTYLASDGDKLRYSGDYFGINRNNNIGLSEDDHIELLSEFNEDNLDGINIDFDLNHYLKMTFSDDQVGFNFDEFNQAIINDIEPQDFEYNAVLWYYEVDSDTENDTNTYTNLYGITFLNNPDNDDDLDNTRITPYKKLVNNDEHDGLSYKHVLNVSTSIDNDTSTLSFDPTSVSNTFGFDLYQNVMSNMSKLNESFINIINEFLRINTEMNDIKSVVYSQVDINEIKIKLQNLEDLLRLYEKYQFVDTESVSILTDYSGSYPTLSFNINHIEYANMYNLTSTDINNYYISNNSIYPITVPNSNKLLINIINDDTTSYSNLGIILSKNLKYKQVIDINISADNAYYSKEFKIYVNETNDLNEEVETELINNIFLPSDIGYKSVDTIIYNTAYYNNNSIEQNVHSIDISGYTINDNDLTVINTVGKNIFGNSTYNQKVFIDNFKVLNNSNNEIIDLSDIYYINQSNYNDDYFLLDLETVGYTLLSNPVIRIIKNYKIRITKISEDDTLPINERYLIEKTYI